MPHQAHLIASKLIHIFGLELAREAALRIVNCSPSRLNKLVYHRYSAIPQSPAATGRMEAH